MPTKLNLRLERKDQPNETPVYGTDEQPCIAMTTPDLGEDYWAYRVAVSEGQAVLGFPKMTLLGCGFAVEKASWNTNLPINDAPERIADHIMVNAGDPSITRDDVIAAITLIRDAARADGWGGRWED